MAGSESNPASLLRLYIDYGRYTEATNLLLEYIESFASLVSSHPYSKAFECQWLLLVFFSSVFWKICLLFQSSHLLRFDIKLYHF